MRLDKFLKVSRILKRRTVAKQVAEGGRVSIGDKQIKPAYNVKAGDIVTIRFGDKFVTFKVLIIDEKTARQQAVPMYEIIESDE